MVDLLAPKKKTGFRIECSAEFEAQKKERAEELGIERKAAGVAVWPADDPRWRMRPPFHFRHYVLKWGGPCVYCAERIEPGTSALYSRSLNSVAHVSCHAGFDREVPEGGVKPLSTVPVNPSVFDRLHDR